jgi:hypothetical protein
MIHGNDHRLARVSVHDPLQPNSLPYDHRSSSSPKNKKAVRRIFPTAQIKKPWVEFNLPTAFTGFFIF